MDIFISNYLFNFTDSNFQVSSYLKNNYKNFIYKNALVLDRVIEKVQINMIVLEKLNTNEIKDSDINISCRFINEVDCNIKKTYYHASIKNVIIANVEYNWKTSTCEMKFDFWNERVFELCFSMLFKIISQDNSIVLLHSSAIEIDNRAVLFCGKSGAGKSTIISHYNSPEILTDEISTLQTINGGSWYVPIPWRAVTSKQLELGCICILKKSKQVQATKIQDQASLILSKYIYFNIWDSNKKKNSINTIRFAAERYNVYELEIPINFDVSDFNNLLRRLIYE